MLQGGADSENGSNGFDVSSKESPLAGLLRNWHRAMI
jgi:hypothetical protein